MSQTLSSGPSVLPEAPSLAAPAGRPHATLFADYCALFKIRVTTMVVISAWCGFYMASVRSGISTFNPQLLETLLGVALASAGGSALNEAMERVYDAKMIRTAQRPLASGRFSLPHGLALGLICVAAAGLLLALETNLVTGTLTMLTVFTYVAVYTPLKRYTPWATFVGAFPGAMPPLIGWTAARATVEAPAAALFAILFVWQFPHFMAIAWLYREDYGRAGIRMRPVIEPDGRSTVREAITYAILMIPVSLLPVWLHMAGKVYGVAAVLLGVGYLAYSIRFRKILAAPASQGSRKYARDLLQASVIYLPLLLGAMMINAIAVSR